MGFNWRVQYLSSIKWIFQFLINLLFSLHFKAILDNTKDFKRLKSTSFWVISLSFTWAYSKLTGSICHCLKSTGAIVPVAPALKVALSHCHNISDSYSWFRPFLSFWRHKNSSRILLPSLWKIDKKLWYGEINCVIDVFKKLFVCSLLFLHFPKTSFFKNA